MKHILHLIVITMAMFLFSACSESNYEPEMPSYIETAKAEDIQGSWHNSSYGTYRSVTFNDNKYTIRFMDEASNRITDSETGRFMLDGEDMTLEATNGESKFSPLKVYWEDGNHTQLKIYPLGSFLRSGN